MGFGRVAEWLLSAGFCGILVEWVSNIKEDLMSNVSSAVNWYIEGPVKYKKIGAKFFAV